VRAVVLPKRSCGPTPAGLPVRCVAAGYRRPAGDRRVYDGRPDAGSARRAAEVLARADCRRMSLAVRVCHPPAAWDQVEGFFAMSMGPPGRQ